MTTTRNGVASKEVQRALGIAHKTAHKMTTQVRKLMQEYGHAKMLGGHVELDEAYVSTGKVKGVEKGRGTLNKKPVFAIVERMGEARAFVMDEIKMRDIHPLIEANVDKNAQVSTDEFPLYTNLNKIGYINHGVIKHAIEEYRRGHISTNTIEGFFAS